MRKAAITLTTMLLFSAVFLSGAAHAAWDWCWDDPVVSIEGRIVNIEVGVPSEYLDDIRGKVPVTIYVPEGTDASVLATTNLHFTEKAKIKYVAANAAGSSVPVSVVVAANANVTFPVVIRVTQNRANGTLEVLEFNGSGGRGQTATASFNVDPLIP